MGPTTTGVTNVPVQANTTTNNYLTPLLVPPPTSTYSPAIHLGRGQHFFLTLFPMVSTCVHTNIPLSLSTIRPTAVPSR